MASTKWLMFMIGYCVVMATVECCGRKPPQNGHVRRNCLASDPSPNTGLDWVHAENGSAPELGVQAGDEGCYIGRAYHDGQWVSGKMCPKAESLAIAHGGKEIVLRQYEILVNSNGEDLMWRGAENGNAPNGSVPTAFNCHFFVCAAPHAASALVPGNMDPPGLHCSVPAGGEHKKPNYRVLINRVPKRYWFTNVTFDTTKAQIRMTPKRLAVKRMANLSDRTQTLVQPVFYHSTEVRHWEPTFGARVGIPVDYEVSVPVIGPEYNGTRNITVKSGIEYEGVWGREDRSEQLLTISASVTLPPRHAADVTVLSDDGVVRIPYSATLHVLFIDGTITSKTITGWFVGSNLYDARISIGKLVPIPGY